MIASVVPGVTVELGVSGTVVLAIGASVLYAVYELYSPLFGKITSEGCLVKGDEVFPPIPSNE